MKPLIEQMVDDDPHKRPTIDEVIAQFDASVRKLGDMKLHSRPKVRAETFKPSRDINSFFKAVKLTVLRAPGVPAHKESRI